MARKTGDRLIILAINELENGLDQCLIKAFFFVSPISGIILRTEPGKILSGAAYSQIIHKNLLHHREHRERRGKTIYNWESINIHHEENSSIFFQAFLRGLCVLCGEIYELVGIGQHVKNTCKKGIFESYCSFIHKRCVDVCTFYFGFDQERLGASQYGRHGIQCGCELIPDASVRYARVCSDMVCYRVYFINHVLQYSTLIRPTITIHIA